VAELKSMGPNNAVCWVSWRLFFDLTFDCMEWRCLEVKLARGCVSK